MTFSPTSVPTSGSDPRQSLHRALAATGRLIDGVGADQWSDPTPCSEWTVRQLVNHLVGGHLGFAAMLAKQPRPDHNADHLGRDPARAFREAAAALEGSFDRPGVLEELLTTPFGQAPGAAVLQVRTTETLVHGWDLAKATGQPADLPDDLAEQALGFARAQMGESAADREGQPFAPAQPAPPDAPAIDRLAAFMGRGLG